MPLLVKLFRAVELVMALPSHLPSPTPPTGTFLPAMSRLRIVFIVAVGLGRPATVVVLLLGSGFAGAGSERGGGAAGEEGGGGAGGEGEVGADEVRALGGGDEGG